MKLVNARTLCLDLDMLDENDLHEERIDYPLALEQDKDHLPDPQRLKDRIAFHKKCLKELEETGRKSLTFTDSGGAMMPAKEGGLKACYNVQTVVDAGSHMAVSFHVADNSSDRGQISGSMGLCKEELDLDAVSVIADKDYESAEDIRKCLLNGIVPEVRWIQDRKEQVFPMDYIARESAAERKASTKPEDVQDCLQVGGLLRRYQHPHPGTIPGAGQLLHPPWRRPGDLPQGEGTVKTENHPVRHRIFQQRDLPHLPQPMHCTSDTTVLMFRCLCTETPGIHSKRFRAWNNTALTTISAN